MKNKKRQPLSDKQFLKIFRIHLKFVKEHRIFTKSGVLYNLDACRCPFSSTFVDCRSYIRLEEMQRSALFGEASMEYGWRRGDLNFITMLSDYVDDEWRNL